MTNSQRWLAFSGVLSVGAGFLGGMMFSRRRGEDCPTEYPAFGNIYYVGKDVYLDGAAVDFLTVRADSRSIDQGWTILVFAGRALFIKKFHDGAVFPGQRGAAYIRRPFPGREARYEEMTSAMLGDLGGFGVLKSHRWTSWDAVKAEMTSREGHRQ
jgi:hypothetical protein